MNTLVVERVNNVAGRKQDKSGPRDRVDLRAEPEWIARVTAVAERFGLSLSAYIRLATTERLERDEAAAAPTKKRPRGE
jgi:hypothetical protein